MAEFQHYGTLKVALELRSVPVIIFVQAAFRDGVARFSRFFGFNSTYQSGKEKLTNLYYNGGVVG